MVPLFRDLGRRTALEPVLLPGPMDHPICQATGSRNAASALCVLLILNCGVGAATSVEERCHESRSERASRSKDCGLPVVEVVESKSSSSKRIERLGMLLVDRPRVGTESLRTAISMQAGVSRYGQNGLNETFGLRGITGNAVQVQFLDIPLTGQRRAGVSASFIEPSLLSAIAISLGPSTSIFGPDASGGNIDLLPRWETGVRSEVGYDTGGAMHSGVAAWGSSDISLAVAKSARSEQRSTQGSELNSGFERSNALLRYQWHGDSFSLTGTILSALAENVGKSNSRFPGRSTFYPQDSHLLMHLLGTHDSGANIAIFSHDQEFETENRRSGSPIAWSNVSSTDIGAKISQSASLGAVDVEGDLQLLQRLGVHASDSELALGPAWRSSLSDASEAKYSLGATAVWVPAPLDFVRIGGRASLLRQEQGEASRRAHSAVWFGEVGVGLHPGARIALKYSIGSRFPTLEERFYSGVTAQGRVLGNVDLGVELLSGPELSYEAELGRLQIGGRIWRSAGDGFIRLEQVDAETSRFANASAVSLNGGEVDMRYARSPTERVRLSLSVAEGTERAGGADLSGVGPHRFDMEFWKEIRGVEYYLTASHRLRFTKPGFDETERASATEANVGLVFPIGAVCRIEARVSNLLNQKRYSSQDALSALEPERSLGLNLACQTAD